jgi:DNA-directed RNA polymerase subunit RPC12/RpoP
MIENKDIRCPYCGNGITVKFPCCGYLCMRCGKTFEEEDIRDLGESVGDNKLP